MANLKISELTVDTSPRSTDTIVTQRGGSENFQVSLADAASFAGPFGDYGSLIFAWNRQDTSQFEPTAHAFERAGGNAAGPNAATALSLSVVDASAEGVISAGIGNVLKVTATNLSGGGVFGILTSSLSIDLPNRFVVQIQVLSGSSFATNPIFFANYTPDDGGGNFQGWYTNKPITSAGSTVIAVVNNEGGNFDNLHNAGTWDGAVAELGGVFQTITVFRQTGSTPAETRMTLEERLMDLTDEPGFDGSLIHGISGVGTNWDGVDLNRVGIAGHYYGSALGTVSGYTYFGDIRIYRHPWDT